MRGNCRDRFNSGTLLGVHIDEGLLSETVLERPANPRQPQVRGISQKNRAVRQRTALDSVIGEGDSPTESLPPLENPFSTLGGWKGSPWRHPIRST